MKLTFLTDVAEKDSRYLALRQELEENGYVYEPSRDRYHDPYATVYLLPDEGRIEIRTEVWEEYDPGSEATPRTLVREGRDAIGIVLRFITPIQALDDLQRTISLRQFREFDLQRYEQPPQEQYTSGLERLYGDVPSLL